MQTIQLKQIFPNYKEFQEKAKKYGIVPLSNDEQYFNMIYRRFHNCQIAYETESDFLFAFFEIYESETPSYIQQQKMYEMLINLDNDSILFERETIQNYARANNKPINGKPLETILGYITDQNSSRVKENTAIQLKMYLDDLHRNYTLLYLDKYKDLFIKIFIGEEYYGY